MLLLGIETSCDETAAAVVADGQDVLSNIILSSRKEQAAFHGVFPEIAARRQIEYILPVIHQALQVSGVRHQDLNALAVTKGPGLLISLLVGVMTARVLASLWKKPLLGVHHTLGHLSSPWLERKERLLFPLLTLSVSGGHTELWLRTSHTKGQLLGTTRDDAAGEAFDKGAVLLGLPYPGGPALAKLAQGGGRTKGLFPQPLKGEETYDFSFSGLKTALKYLLRDRGGLEAMNEEERRDIAAEYEEAICQHLATRIYRALQEFPSLREVHLVGGVAANTHLRSLLQRTLQTQAPQVTLRLPVKLEYCTDNAAMIAAAGTFLLEEQGNAAFEGFEAEASCLLS